jgi:aspartyl aminopeptidase
VITPRLDNIVSVYSSLSAFVGAKRAGASVLAVFDNEEVGSATRQGAASDFLYTVLRLIAGDKKKYKRAICDGFAVSCDNAHARHPNHPELSDPTDAPILGGGVAVKYNTNQKYTTTALSASVFSMLAERAGERVQRYSNRADMPGGSTLGSIANTKVPLLTVDVGVPQLAMHSSSEVCCEKDVLSLEKILSELYSVNLSIDSKKISVE